MHLRNRLMMTTHGPRLPQQRYLRYLEVRSRDVALVGIHAGYGMGTFPPGPGRFHPDSFQDPDAVAPNPLTEEGRAWCERFVDQMAEQAAVVHKRGACCVGQLHHAGAAQSADTLGIVSGPSRLPDEFRRRAPHPLSQSELSDLIEVYSEAAGRVARSGCDGVEIHAAHGYLLNQFLSPSTNVRTDAYGGSFENRLRLLVEVIEAVQAAVGAGFPIGVRIPGSEHSSAGLSNDEMCVIARHLAESGVAYLSVSNGNYTGLQRGLGVAYVAPTYVASGQSISDAGAIREASGIPVVVAGRISDPEMAERILTESRADIVGFTRALIADPRIFDKARRGVPHLIDRCIACNECHTGGQVRCTVNPAAGREEELESRPTLHTRRVVVVGGGVAGLQCARLASGRGHVVTLIERDEVLGGVLRLLARDERRPELVQYCDHLRDELERASTEVRLGVEVRTELLLDLSPDVVVLATGADEVLPPVPGAQLPHVLSALAMTRGRPVPEGHVVVAGGLDDHVAPFVAADALARSGRRVTLLTELVAGGEAVEPATRFELLRLLHSQGVSLRPLTALSHILRDRVVVRDVLTNEEEEVVDVDGVVIVCPRAPRDRLAEELAAVADLRPFAVHSIGDCLAPRRLVHAAADAVRQAVEL